jgi:hypothetical protein
MGGFRQGGATFNYTGSGLRAQGSGLKTSYLFRFGLGERGVELTVVFDHDHSLDDQRGRLNDRKPGPERG